MKTKFTLAAAASLALLFAGAVPAFAEDGVQVTANASTSVQTRLPKPALESGRPLIAPKPEDRGSASSTETHPRFAAREQAAKDAADKQLAARTASLTKLSTRISSMAHLTADQKAAITASITVQISALTTLQGTIDADTATTTLKADIASITKAYRIYALVEPEITVLAAADRALGIADMLTTLSGKLATRVSASANPSTLQPLLDDLNAKVADAKVQSQAAIDATVALKPDNGDKTVAAANDAALKGARTKLQLAEKDLRTAQNDANQVYQGLRGTKPSVTASPTMQTH